MTADTTETGRHRSKSHQSPTLPPLKFHHYPTQLGGLGANELMNHLPISHQNQRWPQLHTKRTPKPLSSSIFDAQMLDLRMFGEQFLDGRCEGLAMPAPVRPKLDQPPASKLIDRLARRLAVFVILWLHDNPTLSIE
jgi:hypothetical protein